MILIWSNNIVRPNLEIYEMGDRDALCSRADRVATGYIIRVGQGYASIHASTRGGESIVRVWHQSVLWVIWKPFLNVRGA